MKTLVYHQNIKDQAGMLMGVAMAEKRLREIGFYNKNEFAETDKAYTTVSFSNETVGKGVAVNPYEILAQARPGYRLTCLIFDASKVTPPATNPVMHGITQNGTTAMQIPVQWYSDLGVPRTYIEVLCHYYLHELAHFVAYACGMPDMVHAQATDSQWSQKPPIDYYLHLISLAKDRWHIIGADKPDAVVPVPPPFSTLKVGSMGERVKQLQKDLNALGHFNYSLGFTLVFGPVTKAAVISFQKSAGILADGIYGPKTHEKLQAALKKKAELAQATKWGLKPLVHRLMDAFLKACAAQGYEVKVTEGYRSFERQNQLYNQTRDGKDNDGDGRIDESDEKVTNAKGGQSFHQYGVAFDVIYKKDGKWTYNIPDSLAIQVGHIGQNVGLEWGGVKDMPHFQQRLGYTLSNFQRNEVDWNKFA